MKANISYLLVLFVLLSNSCSDNTDEVVISSVVADFDSNLTIEQYQAKLTLTNISEEATEFEWAFSSGTPENSTEENPTVMFYKNGTHTATLRASNGEHTDIKSVDIVVEGVDENAPYRYLENESILMYFETEDKDVYKSLIPEPFNMPSKCVAYSFFIDFYKLDYGLTPYKENGVYILVEYQGEEFWHCVYMPVTDQRSMWAGIIGLGLPKTLGEISLTRDAPIYSGRGENPFGGVMNMNLDVENYTIDEATKQEMIALSKHRSLQIRDGNIITTGRSNDGANSVIEASEKFPDLLTLKFGEVTFSTNTETIAVTHPLDLTPSRVIGAYYLKNTIPFELTGSPL